MLNASLMGLTLENPIVVASGPWTRGHNNIRKCLEQGAGAVFTESIVSEPYPDLSPRYSYNKENGGVQNIRLYSGMDLETWLVELEELKKAKRYGCKGKVIASIMASSPSELVYIAKKVEKTGVDGIEIGISCPMTGGPERMSGDPRRVYEYTKAVVDTVSIPVSVKLSAVMSDSFQAVKAAEKAEAAGISAIDAVRCILSVDVETHKPCLPTYGGLSGAPIKPLALATVAEIAENTQLPVLGIGGVTDYVNILEYIMVGACAAGIGSGILLNGYDTISNAVKGLELWLEAHHIRDLEEIKGCALKNLRTFEEIRIEPKIAHMKGSCSDGSCMKCVSCCIDEAVSMKSGGILIDEQRCTGCGLCVDICREKKMEMVWK